MFVPHKMCSFFKTMFFFLSLHITRFRGMLEVFVLTKKSKIFNTATAHENRIFVALLCLKNRGYMLKYS